MRWKNRKLFVWETLRLLHLLPLNILLSMAVGTVHIVDVLGGQYDHVQLLRNRERREVLLKVVSFGIV